jgi:diguanylate cyclase (GGDEF)-like protein
LYIGSYDAERFTRSVRTDFFEHFSAIFAICLENATNLERLKRQGLTDTLTALNNRRFFDQRLLEEVEIARRKGNPLSCLLLDVDHFKRINDTYGHLIGDQVLMRVAALIRAQMRTTDVLSRYGGEEFSALLAQTPEQEADDVAERIRASIEQCDFIADDGQHFNVSISIGVATLDGDMPGQNVNASVKNTAHILVGQADQALYKAKSSGRNQVVCRSDIS